MDIGLYTTAAFISAGMHRDIPKLDAAKELLGTGCFELVTTGVEYTEFVNMMHLVGGMIVGGIPGVFDYEVSEEFGVWYVDYVHQHGQIPRNGTACDKLIELGMAFFVREDMKDHIVGGPSIVKEAFGRIDVPKQPEV